MRFHAKVPRVALLAGVHLGVALLRLVLGGAGRGDQGGVYGGTCSEQQAFVAQQLVDGSQHLIGEFVCREAVAKPQNGALVW